jgi:hypothetical protein
MQAQSSASERLGKSFARRRGCAAYLYIGRTFDSRQRSRRREHAAQQATWMRRCQMTLDDEDIEQIARRVAELIGSSHAPRYVDATDLAQILGVDREWVYAHARRLGAIRLSEPGGRLRFDMRQVAEALSPPDSTAKPVRRAPSRRRSARTERAEVIQYEH